MNTALYDVCADIGNWGAKVVREGQATVIRNVAIAYDGSDDDFQEAVSFSNNAKGKGDGEIKTESARFWLGEQQWVVGEDAYNINARAQSETSYSRYGSPEWYALIAASFLKLYKRSGTIALTFSMPVSQFRAVVDDGSGGAVRQRDRVAEMLAGTWDITAEDGKRLVFEIDPDQIDMIPEGAGSVAGLCIHPSGRSWIDEKLKDSKKVVFDFGGFTLDVLTFAGLKPLDYNRSLTSGLINVRNTVEAKIMDRFMRGNMPPTVIDEVIRTGRYKHAGGNPVSVKDIVDGALVTLMKDALRVWREDLGNGADYDTVIITGGGGPVLGPLLKPQLGHGDVRIIPAGEAHLANAWGGLARRKLQREIARLQAAQAEA